MLSRDERSTDRALDDLARLSEQIRRRTTDRDSLIAKLHAEGYSLPALAKAASLSVGKVHRLAHDSLTAIGTIGYEGRTIDGFIEELHTHRFSKVIDVRETPMSRKRGFSKRVLEAALSEAGVGYEHRRLLGNPKDNREGFRSGDPRAVDRFETLLQRQGRPDLDAVATEAEHSRIVLMCFERDHRACHRSCISAALQAARPALHVVNV
ncbi:MAG: DUF488 domain-containing protein [Acidimicrobiales bacterium]